MTCANCGAHIDVSDCYDGAYCSFECHKADEEFKARCKADRAPDFEESPMETMRLLFLEQRANRGI